jgi:hypothetical protein
VAASFGAQSASLLFAITFIDRVRRAYTTDTTRLAEKVEGLQPLVQVLRGQHR